MNEYAKLAIANREKGSKGAMHRLRTEGLLPGSISKKGSEAVSFSVNKGAFKKALAAHGMSGIYTLQLDKDTAFTAMIREIQHVGCTEDVLHVTFQAVSMTEATAADVSLHIKGREELHHKGLELLQQLESLHLKGLPGDFPSVIEIDVSQMKAGEHVTVADVQLPKGIVSLTESDRLILSVSHPKIMVEETVEEKETAGKAAASAEGSETARQPGADA